MQSDDYPYDDFKPTWHDLEDPVARNEAYGIVICGERSAKKWHTAHNGCLRDAANGRIESWR